MWKRLVKSLADHCGYFEVDHRDSPGISPADVAHLPMMTAVPGGQILKRDVKQCNHCQAGVVLEPTRVRKRAVCPKCHHYICDACEAIRVKTGTCQEFRRLLDQAQTHVETFVGREDHPDAPPTIVLTDLL